MAKPLRMPLASTRRQLAKNAADERSTAAEDSAPVSLVRRRQLSPDISELVHLVLRVGVAALFIFHAPQKWLGWFGGPPFPLISDRGLTIARCKRAPVYHI
jgi:hypothetical protein